MRHVFCAARGGYEFTGIGGVLSRLENLASTGTSPTAAQKYEQYVYMAAGTLRQVQHPAVNSGGGDASGLTLTYGGSGSYGFDQFGRITDQKWQNSNRVRPSMFRSIGGFIAIGVGIVLCGVIAITYTEIVVSYLIPPMDSVPNETLTLYMLGIGAILGLELCYVGALIVYNNARRAGQRGKRIENRWIFCRKASPWLCMAIGLPVSIMPVVIILCISFVSKEWQIGMLVKERMYANQICRIIVICAPWLLYLLARLEIARYVWQQVIIDACSKNVVVARKKFMPGIRTTPYGQVTELEILPAFHASGRALALQPDPGNAGDLLILKTSEGDILLASDTDDRIPFSRKSQLQAMAVYWRPILVQR